MGGAALRGRGVISPHQCLFNKATPCWPCARWPGYRQTRPRSSGQGQRHSDRWPERDLLSDKPQRASVRTPNGDLRSHPDGSDANRHRGHQNRRPRRRRAHGMRQAARHSDQLSKTSRARAQPGHRTHCRLSASARLLTGGNRPPPSAPSSPPPTFSKLEALTKWHGNGRGEQKRPRRQRRG
jgi:hypothetical protein